MTWICGISMGISTCSCESWISWEVFWLCDTKSLLSIRLWKCRGVVCGRMSFEESRARAAAPPLFGLFQLVAPALPTVGRQAARCGDSSTARGGPTGAPPSPGREGPCSWHLGSLHQTISDARSPTAPRPAQVKPSRSRCWRINPLMGCSGATYLPALQFCNPPVHRLSIFGVGGTAATWDSPTRFKQHLGSSTVRALGANQPSITPRSLAATRCMLTRPILKQLFSQTPWPSARGCVSASNSHPHSHPFTSVPYPIQNSIPSPPANFHSPFSLHQP